jgi:hypothetical protein
VSKRIWTIRDGQVFRYDLAIADVTRQPDGRLTWVSTKLAGRRLERINCIDDQDVIEDVKYFYRYMGPRGRGNRRQYGTA